MLLGIYFLFHICFINVSGYIIEYLHGDALPRSAYDPHMNLGVMVPLRPPEGPFSSPKFPLENIILNVTTSSLNFKNRKTIEMFQKPTINSLHDNYGMRYLKVDEYLPGDSPAIGIDYPYMSRGVVVAITTKPRNFLQTDKYIPEIIYRPTDGVTAFSKDTNSFKKAIQEFNSKGAGRMTENLADRHPTIGHDTPFTNRDVTPQYTARPTNIMPNFRASDDYVTTENYPSVIPNQFVAPEITMIEVPNNYNYAVNLDQQFSMNSAIISNMVYKKFSYFQAAIDILLDIMVKKNDAHLKQILMKFSELLPLYIKNRINPVETNVKNIFIEYINNALLNPNMMEIKVEIRKLIEIWPQINYHVDRNVQDIIEIIENKLFTTKTIDFGPSLALLREYPDNKIMANQVVNVFLDAVFNSYYNLDMYTTDILLKKIQDQLPVHRRKRDTVEFNDVEDYLAGITPSGSKVLDYEVQFTMGLVTEDPAEKLNVLEKPRKFGPHPNMWNLTIDELSTMYNDRKLFEASLAEVGRKVYGKYNDRIRVEIVDRLAEFYNIDFSDKGVVTNPTKTTTETIPPSTTPTSPATPTPTATATDTTTKSDSKESDVELTTPLNFAAKETSQYPGPMVGPNAPKTTRATTTSAPEITLIREAIQDNMLNYNFTYFESSVYTLLNIIARKSDEHLTELLRSIGPVYSMHESANEFKFGPRLEPALHDVMRYFVDTDVLEIKSASAGFITFLQNMHTAPLREELAELLRRLAAVYSMSHIDFAPAFELVKSYPRNNETASKVIEVLFKSVFETLAKQPKETRDGLLSMFYTVVTSRTSGRSAKRREGESLNATSSTTFTAKITTKKVANHAKITTNMTDPSKFIKRRSRLASRAVRKSDHEEMYERVSFVT